MNITGSTRVLGVFGHPVSHSLSPVMHNAAIRALGLDFVYVPFHVLPENLEKAVNGIRALDIAGVNVTIPHKERIIKFLDEVSENARRIGSVNTVINERGRLRGESTDGAGFLRSAEAVWGKIGGKVVILGAGGSAKAVAYALGDAGCEVVIANRTFDRAMELAQALKAAFGADKSRAVGLGGDDLEREIRGADLLVNTTSVGMHPHSDGIPISPELIGAGLKVYDLVYNPLETRLVREARANGAEAMTGLGMLIHQGAVSFEMWTGQNAPVEVMAKSVEHIMSGEL
ncbi:MAG: shikimate dehydrogenase [Armatimonadetes bacterium]|nr:shikimate dehydrogenase [Armatimonadota bacterium]